MQPPVFPLLNTFQRLLIHRLADAFSIARCLDPQGGAGQMQLPGQPSIPSSILVLVKTVRSAM